MYTWKAMSKRLHCMISKKSFEYPSLIYWKKEKHHLIENNTKCTLQHSLEVEDRHPIMSQGSASDTHLGRPELCSPSDSTVQAHPYNWQSVINILNTYFRMKKEILCLQSSQDTAAK